jgi:hypothetical protein
MVIPNFPIWEYWGGGHLAENKFYIAVLNTASSFTCIFSV